MAFSKPLIETLYSGVPVCSLCGGPCNGSPEPTGPVVGEGPERAIFSDTVIDMPRPQPAPPQNTNGEPDFNPQVIP